MTFVVGILAGRDSRKPSATTMLGAPVQKFDAEDLEHHAHKAFQLYDSDNNGHFSMQEFGQIIKDASEETVNVNLLSSMNTCKLCSTMRTTTARAKSRWVS